MSKPRGAPVSGLGKTPRVQTGATPEGNKRPAIASSGRFDTLSLDAEAEATAIAQKAHDEAFVNATMEEFEKEDNPLMAPPEDDEITSTSDDEKEPAAPPPNHAGYAQLLEEHADGAEQKPDIVALKEAGDNDLLGKLENEVMVVAIPIKVKDDSRKKPPPSRAHQSDDSRRGDASKGRYKFALISTVGMFVDEDVGYEHKKDLPSLVKNGPTGALGVLSFANKNSKEKLITAAKDKKSSLNGEIAGFRCRFQDPDEEEYDRYLGYEK